MKVAVCLHGYFGTLSTNDFSTSTGGHLHILAKIVAKVPQVDFYVHCWQPEYKERIKKLYSPKKYLFEEQKDFKTICKENNISQEYIDNGYPRNNTMYRNCIAERILSFYYSRCESLKLSADKDYDFIITTRFDISQRGGSEVRELKFDPSLDPNFFYTSNWNQKNAGYGDMWFFSSKKNMSLYSELYKSALRDFSMGSDYEKCLTSGWPDSHYYNVYSTTDTRQFSNEIDKINKTNKLMKFPKWRMTDSHLHHKWFCIQTGLYEKTKWL